MNIIDKINFAVNKINPNAQITISADKDTTLENVNIIFHNCNTIPKEQILAMIPIVEQEIANEEANRISNKQSALNKLSALGLTEAEIKAIIG